MAKYNNIVAFIDVDNCGMDFAVYSNVIEQINEMGNVVYAKVYGLSDRKHRDIINHADTHGYDTCFGMRVKKRNSKVLDNRIVIDSVETLYSLPNIDAVAMIVAPSDMVYLYRLFKSNDIAIIALDNSDVESVALVDHVVDLGVVELLKLPKKTSPRRAPQKKAVVPQEVQSVVLEPVKVAPQVEEIVQVAPQVEEIVKVAPQVEEIIQEPLQQVKIAPLVEEVPQPTQQPTADSQDVIEDNPYSLIQEAKALLDQVQAYKQEEISDKEKIVLEDNKEVEVSYHGQSDSDLIKRIQEIRDTTVSNDEDELLEKIKHLILTDM